MCELDALLLAAAAALAAVRRSADALEREFPQVVEVRRCPHSGAAVGVRLLQIRALVQ